MQNKLVQRLMIGGFVLVGLILIGLLGLKQLAQAPPAYYADIIKAESTVDTKTRHEQAEVLVGDVVQLRNDLANEPEWTMRVTDAVLNAWLGEHELNEMVGEMPAEVSEPRIRFETEKMKLAFRWAGRPLESVISLSIKPSCIATNEIQIVIDKVQAGLLPVSWTRFQGEITEAIEQNGQKVEWKTVDGQPALVLKIAPRMDSRAIEIQKITVLDGEIRVSGKSQKKP